MSTYNDNDVRRLVRSSDEVSKCIKHLNELYSVHGNYAEVLLDRLQRLNLAVGHLDWAVRMVDETK